MVLEREEITTVFHYIITHFIIANVQRWLIRVMLANLILALPNFNILDFVALTFL